MVTADVGGLYPSILHQASLEAFRGTSDRIKLVKMTEFVLKTNYFQYMNRVYYQNSGTAIGATFTPLYACIVRDQVETKFLQTQFRVVLTIFSLSRLLVKIFRIFLQWNLITLILMLSLLTSVVKKVSIS